MGKSTHLSDVSGMELQPFWLNFNIYHNSSVKDGEILEDKMF